MSAGLLTARAEHVRAILESAGTPMTTDEVAERCRLTRRLAYDALLSLLADGRVQRGGGGRKAPPGKKQYRWRVAPKDGRPQLSVAEERVAI